MIFKYRKESKSKTRHLKMVRRYEMFLQYATKEETEKAKHDWDIYAKDMTRRRRKVLPFYMWIFDRVKCTMVSANGQFHIQVHYIPLVSQKVS